MRFDHTFEEKLRERAHGVLCMWQIGGPKNTGTEGMECLAVFADNRAPRLFIVQTFRGGGWVAFAAVSEKNDIDATMAAADALLKSPEVAEAA